MGTLYFSFIPKRLRLAQCSFGTIMEQGISQRLRRQQLRWRSATSGESGHSRVCWGDMLPERRGWETRPPLIISEELLLQNISKQGKGCDFGLLHQNGPHISFFSFKMYAFVLFILLSHKRTERAKALDLQASNLRGSSFPFWTPTYVASASTREETRFFFFPYAFNDMTHEWWSI